jgi:hypothetical protein
MKMYNFNKFTGGKRIWRGTLYTLPIGIATAVAVGILQHFISIQLSLSYLLLAYIIANTFKKYGRSVSVQASYVAIAIFIISMLVVDLFTIIGFRLPTFAFLGLFTPVILIGKLDLSSISSVINLLIIVYSINIVYNNSRIV